ncbi:hypothetical protein Vretimale_17810 [Volvox reticuliferus]|uniref:Uncharacterized protein n=1 Tax=Volvox reticuliferus TaxID=1737510 RepID=A0A8J4GVX3_9CHLO|nr:hypothetical protein Vretimale_17810 [Volvox reticuliferus]
MPHGHDGCGSSPNGMSRPGVAAEWRPRIGVYDVPRGTVRARSNLTATEVLEVGSGGLPPLPPPSAPLYVGMPSMAALVAHLLREKPTSDAAASEEGRGGGISLRLDTQQWGAERGSSNTKRDAAAPQQHPDTPSSAPAGRGESWEAGPFHALVLTDSQFARVGACRHQAVWVRGGKSPAGSVWH